MENPVNAILTVELGNHWESNRKGFNFGFRYTGHKAALVSVLLPHQFKRLKQISTQVEMKNNGDANALVSSSLAKELGIDGAQARKLQKRAVEIRQEFEQKMAKLKEEARKKLLQELSVSQRKKLKELTGEKFELQHLSIRSYSFPKR